MGRPNFDRMQRQQRELAQVVGEVVSLRRMVDIEEGHPQYGEGDEPQYITLNIHGLLRPMTQEEIQVSGGQYVAGDVVATLIDYVPTRNDEVIWRGVAYRVESEPLPQRIVGNNAQYVVLRRGG